MRKMIIAVLAATMLCGSANASLYFDFSYLGSGTSVNGTAGSPILAIGQLITTDNAVDGHYTVTGITGSRNGVTIDGLASLGGNNNYLYYPSSLFVDNGGISYAASGVTYNFYSAPGSCSVNGAGVTYYEISSSQAATNCTTEHPITLNVTAGRDPSAVPEPVSWAMMVGGFGLIGAAMRRRKVAVSVA